MIPLRKPVLESASFNRVLFLTRRPVYILTVGSLHPRGYRLGDFRILFARHFETSGTEFTLPLVRKSHIYNKRSIIDNDIILYEPTIPTLMAVSGMQHICTTNSARSHRTNTISINGPRLSRGFLDLGVI